MLEMDFKGLEELIQNVESLGCESDLEKVNKQMLNECGNVAYDSVKSRLHKSKDHSKSGSQHKGSQRLTPPAHACDSIPKPKFIKYQGKTTVQIGWGKGDNSEYHYEKYEEFGTSIRPAHCTFGKTNKMLRSKYDKIAKKHYEKLLKKLER